MARKRPRRSLRNVYGPLPAGTGPKIAPRIRIREEPRVVVFMPGSLPVTEAELDLLDQFLSDVIDEMIRQKTA